MKAAKIKTIRRKRSWPAKAKWISCDIYSSTYRFWSAKPRERKGGNEFSGASKNLCTTILYAKIFPSGELRKIV